VLGIQSVLASSLSGGHYQIIAVVQAVSYRFRTALYHTSSHVVFMVNRVAPHLTKIRRNTTVAVILGAYEILLNLLGNPEVYCRVLMNPPLGPICGQRIPLHASYPSIN
jgi:hypothetical protein